MHLLSHISTYVILAQVVLLLASYVDRDLRTRDRLANLYSYGLLLSLYVIVVVGVAQECPEPLKYAVLILKSLLLAGCLARFQGRIRYDALRMATSIAIMGAYSALVDLRVVYRCDVRYETLALSLLLSVLAYGLLACLG